MWRLSDGSDCSIRQAVFNHTGRLGSTSNLPWLHWCFSQDDYRRESKEGEDKAEQGEEGKEEEEEGGRAGNAAAPVKTKAAGKAAAAGQKPTSQAQKPTAAPGEKKTGDVKALLDEEDMLESDSSEEEEETDGGSGEEGAGEDEEAATRRRWERARGIKPGGWCSIRGLGCVFPLWYGHLTRSGTGCVTSPYGGGMSYVMWGRMGMAAAWGCHAWVMRVPWALAPFVGPGPFSGPWSLDCPPLHGPTTAYLLPKARWWWPWLFQW